MKNRGLGLIAAVLTLGCGGTAEEAPPALNSADNLQPIGQVGTVEGALYSGLATTGGLVYGCTAQHGMRIARIEENRTLSTVVERVDVPDGEGCRALAVAPDGALFVAGESTSGGSWIASVATDGTGTMTPAALTSAGLIETLAASDTHVFAVLGNGGLRIFGRNDGLLDEVGALEAGFDQALGVAVWGEQLVVANGLAGVVLVDISDPSKPSLGNSVNTAGTARRVTVSENTAFVADVGGGVSAFKLNGSTIQRIDTWDTHGSSVDLAMGASGMLFVANLEDLVVLDASDPSSLQLAATDVIPSDDGSPGRIVAVSVDQSTAIAAEWSGLWTYDFQPGKNVPDIHVSKPAVDLGLVSLKKSKGLIVQNLGTAVLEITSFSVDHDDFSIDLDSDRLGPGKKALLEVSFEPTDTEPVDAVLTLITNDPDEGTVHIPLRANTPGGIQVGAPFDPNNDRVFTEYITGNGVTVGDQYPGKVVILAWFGTT